jgi:nucleoside-diphosphate-sugar epimerase
MKYLVTGGAGFIGSTLVKKLFNAGHDVIVVDNLTTGNIIPPSSVKFIKGDVTDFDFLKTLPQVDGIFHLAAMSKVLPSLEDPAMVDFCAHQNSTGTLNVLKLASSYSPPIKVVYSASSTYYGLNPIPQHENQPHDCQTPYALTKYMGELWCEHFSRLYDIPTVRLRYFMVYGPNEPSKGSYAIVTGIFKKRAASGLPLEIHGDGSQTRDFVHVDDVAEANIRAMQSNINNDTINVGTGTQVSIKELADLISTNQVYTPKRKVDLQDTLCDTTKLERLLHWKPTRNIRDSILTIVTSHWKEDLAWLKKSKFPVVLIDKEGAAPTCFEPQYVIENKGVDTAVIFTYIIKNYDCLPDHVAFIHGHEKSYHQMHDRHLLEVIESANIHKYGYIPLNNMMRKYQFCNETQNVPEMPGLMLKDRTIKLGIKPLPELYDMNVPIGCQFITSRERIQNVPKATWENWLEALMSPEHQEAKVLPVVFEYILHIILGERPDMEIESDWFSFGYRVNWWHEIPQLCFPESIWRSMGLEPLPC